MDSKARSMMMMIRLWFFLSIIILRGSSASSSSSLLAPRSRIIEIRGGNIVKKPLITRKREGKNKSLVVTEEDNNNTAAEKSTVIVSSSSTAATKEQQVNKQQQKGKNQNISLKPMLLSSLLMTLAVVLVGLSPPPILIDRFGSNRATSILSTLSSLAAAFEIILSPIFGSLSDSIGRKPVMIMATLAMSIVNAIVGASFFSGNNNPAILVSLSKLTGSMVFPLLFISSSAVVGDVMGSTPEKMGSFMALSMSLSSLGVIAGVTTAGKVLGNTNINSHGILYFASSASAILSALVIVVGLPETLTHKKPMSNTNLLQKIKESPISASKLILGRGKQIRWLAILLVLQSFSGAMGDLFQVYSKDVWGLNANDFSTFVSLFFGISFFSTLGSSLLIGGKGKIKMNLRSFTMLATISSLFYPLGACISYKASLVGIILGFFASSQSLGVVAQIMATSTSTKGISQGELAGERASLIAMTKVIGPLFYGALYLFGTRIRMPQLIFAFNVLLALLAVMVAFDRKRELWV